MFEAIDPSGAFDGKRAVSAKADVPGMVNMGMRSRMPSLFGGIKHGTLVRWWWPNSHRWQAGARGARGIVLQ
eukprot:scaffold258692_cov46-Prasinocladus_malaysianus.AAC.1